MITNYEHYRKLQGEKLNVLKCGKYLAKYFEWECFIPVFAIDDEGYRIFIHNESLRKAIEKMPINYRIILITENFWAKIKDKPPARG